jgi:hypothetical protein
MLRPWIGDMSAIIRKQPEDRHQSVVWCKKTTHSREFDSVKNISTRDCPRLRSSQHPGRISSYAMHRRVKVYGENVTEFRPEQSADEEQLRPERVFLPV